MNLKILRDRIILFILGIVVLTLGVSLTIKANLGAGSWDSVNVGLSNRFSLSVGSFAFIIAIIMTILAGMLRNGKFNFYTLVTAFILSGCTDFWLVIVNKIPLNNRLLERGICFVLGILILSIGLAIYLTPNLVPNSIDDCMMAFREKFNLNVGTAKFLADSLGIIIALIVSGPIGIGTIVITISVGPLVNVVFNKLNKILGTVN
ncbi:YczE/YyaS/YitT family protein [Clostridium beijerinckii]|uniref:Membrane protein YczE n=1 Tax=Clostridium beijerinckii TaxID=1520 RepID=A0AAW3W413_CLOBE|nr:YitT family protein [Clostridium beijerinckii]MBC2456098.1 hypothetical protein [Clostridium beijerinckii]MBC2473645.1 hypothetical protein [Clostridium beijerinckii]NOV62986.1 hypothetical protein [Clostridium beijerinckii]NOV70052.1 hypothetical protein [Clostridium beijerinckii]NOW31041.1 hypothetical protein [Clostridium beijerinckii]